MSHDVPAGQNATGKRIMAHPVLGALPARASLAIAVDGATLYAREGETVAAALLANGIRVFRTMPTYGEARGGFCFVGRCSDCQMVIDGVPGRLACMTIVGDGMRISTQEALGSWDTDGGAE